MPTNHLLLIHGAWQGSWVWRYVTPYLEERGWIVHVVDLPGTLETGDTPSLDRYVAICKAALPASLTSAFVVGHSGGAVVAAQFAECFRDRVAALVFLAGILLPSGVLFADLAAQLQADTGEMVDGIEPYLQWSPDHLVSTVPAFAAHQIFLHDCTPEQVREAGENLQPQHERGRALCPTLSEERFGRVPRIYIEAENDRSIPLIMQRYMQKCTPGCARLSMKTGHAPQIADPEGLARLLTAQLGSMQT